jgi:hypothetical protein
MKLLSLRQAFVLALLFLMAQLSWGQGATTAAMSGTIADGKGQALPGATVIAVHTPTNTQYVAPTNADGRFNIQNMRVGGPYTVKVTFVGFQDFNRTGINLTLAENFRLDVKLSDASTQLTEVTVTGRQNPIINADRTGAATTIQRAQIERLPTINRSLSDYTRLTPQASGGGGFAGRNNLYNNVYKEEDTVVPRAELPTLLKGVKEIGARYGFKSVCYGHAGDGNLHVNIIRGALTDEQWNVGLRQPISEIFELCVKLGGTISGEHGIGLVQKPYMHIALKEANLNIMRGIKQVFDPNGILNPGKIF